MIHSDTCDKCKRRNPIAFRIEPKEAWDTVVLNRWRSLCPTCFDVEARHFHPWFSTVDQAPPLLPLSDLVRSYRAQSPEVVDGEKVQQTAQQTPKS